MSQEKPHTPLHELEAEITTLQNAETGVTAGDYLVLSRKVVGAKHQFPEARQHLAYLMTSLGSRLPEKDEQLQEITDLFATLEVPDGHVDSSDGLSVDQKWDRIEALSAEPTE